eukprot:7164987-Prymnesium_polylepis.1
MADCGGRYRSRHLHGKAVAACSEACHLNKHRQQGLTATNSNEHDGSQQHDGSRQHDGGIARSPRTGPASSRGV